MQFVPLDDELEAAGGFTFEPLDASDEPKKPEPPTLRQYEQELERASQAAFVPPRQRMREKPKEEPLTLRQFEQQQENQEPDRTWGQAVTDTARNLAASALKIGPTALKGVADVGNMLTGDTVDLGVSKSMERGMKAIDEVVASDKFNQQQAGFQAVMQDESKGIGDMFAYMLDNPSILVDNSITTIGSMFLPVGVAKGAAVGMKLAGAGAAATSKAAVIASIGTSAAQNAADTFSSLEQQPLDDRYKGAAVSAAVSLLAGIATGGGAEAQIARKMAGDLQAGRIGMEAVKSFLKSVGNEAAQESGEEIGNISGEAVGSGESVNLTNAAKRTTFAGTLGGIMGGGVNLATDGVASIQQQAIANQTAKLEALKAERDKLEAMRAAAATPEATAAVVTAPDVQTVDQAIAAAQAATQAPAQLDTALEANQAQGDAAAAEAVDTVIKTLIPSIDQNALQQQINAMLGQPTETEPNVEVPAVATPDAGTEGGLPSAGVASQPVEAAGLTLPSYSFRLNDTGTLSVSGDTATALDILAQAGITSGIIKSADGIRVSVPKAPAAKAALEAAVTPPSAPAESEVAGQPVVLQNRDRTSAASVAQMTEIASNPDYLRTGPSREMQSGSPVVLGDLPKTALPGRTETVVDGKGDRIQTRYAVVEAADLLPSNRADGTPNPEYANGLPGKLRAVAGNGRTAGIQAAYERGTADGYKTELLADAENLGVDPAAVRAMKAPVLVRLMRAADVKADMGDRTNISSTQELSPVEQATNDARRVNIAGLQFDDNGDPTPQTLRAFIARTPVSERGRMQNPDGTPTRQAVDRLMAATFKVAYGSDELVQLYAQATDPEARAVISAVADAAGVMANLEGTGQYDIRAAVAGAAKMAVNASRQGLKLADVVKNADLDMDAEAFGVAQFMADNIRSPKRMAEGLRAMGQQAAEQARIEAENAQQDAMFGATPTIPRQQILESLNGTAESPVSQLARVAGDGQAVTGDRQAAGPAGAAPDLRGVEGEAAAGAEAGDSEGLTAPTQAEVLAAQDRADNADALDEREQVRKESEAGSGSFQLQALDGRVDDTGMLFSRGNIRRSFAGPNSKTADTRSLATAQQRLDAGDDAELVRQETSWSKGVDGKWRYEISDADASFIGKDELERMAEADPYKLAQTTLGEVLDHPALFAAYPDLRNVNVVYEATSAAGGDLLYGASYNSEDNTITLGNGLTSDEMLSGLLHEVQHGIQNTEGFAYGGSQESVGRQSNWTEADRLEYAEAKAEFDQIDRDATPKEWDAALKALSKKRNELNHRVYLRLAGEVEARNTQARQRMTDAERRATPPSATADVADADVIVTFNGKVAENAPAPANGVRRSFAGERAQTADQFQLKNAKAMLERGTDPERVRRETGWSRDVDGKWKFEISDDEAHLLLNFPDVGTLGEAISRIQNESGEATLYTLLDHEKLYAAYPHLKRMRVYFASNEDLGGARGSYNPAYDIINLNRSILPDQALSTLMHEIQHAIQEFEGFARGGNADTQFARRVKQSLEWLEQDAKLKVERWSSNNYLTVTDAERTAAVARNALMYESAQRLMAYANRDKPSGVFRLIKNEIQWIYHEDFRGNQEAMDLQRMFYSVPPSHRMKERNAYIRDMAERASQLFQASIPREQLQAFRDDERTTQSMVAALQRQANKAYKALAPLRELERAEKNIAAVRQAHEYSTPFEIYQSLAGEVEARNTQARLKMTAEERRNKSPLLTADVKPENVVVMFGGLQIEAPMLSLEGQPAHTPDQLREAARKTHGNLLDQGEKKGLVKLAGLDELIDLAAKDRAAVTGGDWQEIKLSILASVQNSVAPQRELDADGMARLQRVAEIVAGGNSPSNQIIQLGRTPAVLRMLGASDVRLTFDPLKLHDALKPGKKHSLTPGVVVQAIRHLSDPVAVMESRTKAGDMVALTEVVAEDGRPMVVAVALDKRGGVKAINKVSSVYAKDDSEGFLSLNLRENRFRYVNNEKRRSLPEARRLQLPIGGANPTVTSSRATSVGANIVSEVDLVNFEQGVEVKRSANGDINGFHDPKTGKSYLNADVLAPDTIGPVLVHEMWHGANQAGALDAVNARAAALIRAGKGNPFFDRVAGLMRDAGETSNEEAAAYLVQAWEQDTINAPAPVVRWVQNLVAAVRAWLFNKGIILKADQLTEADIAAVARMMAKEQVEARAAEDGQVSFSRESTPEGDAATVSTPDYDGEVITRVINDRISRTGTRLVFAETFSDLPADVQSRMINADMADAMGMTDRGAVYLIGERIPTKELLEATIVHELYGHIGLRKLFGADLYLRLNKLYLNLGDEKVKALAQKYGLEANGYFEAAERLTQNASQRFIYRAGGRVEAKQGWIMEELLAHIAEKETGTLKQQALEVIGAIRNWLREHGFADLAERNMADIAYVLKRGRFAAENVAGYKGMDDAPAFSRGRRQGSVFASQFSIPDETRLQKFQRKIQDQYNRVKIVQDLLRQQGGNVSEATDVYRAEERMHGIVQEKMVDLRDQVLKPLLKKTAQYGIDLGELALYAYAKHAQERNAYIAGLRNDMPDNGSGMTNQEAQDILDQVRQDGKEQQFEELHQTLMQINQMKLDAQLQSGLISQNEYGLYMSQYQHYVPLRGFEAVGEDGKESTKGKGTGKRFNIRGKESMRALGRTSRAADIVENLITDYQVAVVRSEKNRVLQRFLQLVIDNPDPTLWEIDAIRSRAALDRATGKVSTSFVVDKGPDTLGLKINGQEIYLKIHDPLLLRAMRGPEDNRLAEVAKWASDTTGHYLNLLRNTLTRFNPEFAVTNAQRDLGMALPMVINQLGEKGGALFAKHYVGASRASWSFLRGKLNKRSPEWQQYFTEYRESGGTTGGFYVKDADELRTDLRGMMIAAGAEPKTAYERLVKASNKIGLRHVGNVLEFVGQVSEHAARVAAFRAAREMGKSPAQAAAIAKNLTTNFNRKGEWGGLFNALYLFGNASIQGNAALVPMLKNPRMYIYFAGMVGATAGLAMWGASVGGEDDDGELYWDKIPAHIRERNLIFMLPPGLEMDGAEKVGTHGHYLAWAAPFGLNTFSNLGYALADVYRNQQDPMRGRTPARAAWHMVSGVAATLNPFGGSLTSAESTLLMILPTILDLPTQFVLGIDAFGKPVAPQTYDEESTVDSENVNIRQSGGPSHMLARWINKITGGDQETKGAIDVSPGSIENVARNVTGGAGKFVYDSISLAGKAFDENPDIFVREVPFVRRGYGQVDGDVDQGLFYERRAEVNVARAEEKRKEKADKELTDPEVIARASLADTASDITKRLGEIRRELIALRQDETASETYRRATEKELKRERDELITEFNRQWREAMEALEKEKARQRQ